MTASAALPARREPGFVEFVCLIALMMALNALAIDSMLPALPHIGEDLGVANENTRQWVVTAYLLGFGGAQLIYGPLADRFGRKRVLLTGVGIYVLFSLLATLAPSFETLIAARVGQGLGSACTRVLAVSIVRDRYEGRTMARVMSFSFLVFLGVPILAPSIGQLIMLVGPWRWIFAGLGLVGVCLIVWAALRLPETLKPEDRLPIQARRLMSAYRVALTDRTAVGYTLAMTAITGALFGFINSSQQIFADVFEAEAQFPAIFALIAGGIAVASLVNARWVVKLGSRRISHTALIGFTFVAAVHAAVALSGHESIWTFAVLQTLTMFCFGLIAGNFGSMAMETMGKIAGTASSVQGFISTIGGSLLGFAIGQQFNGTVAPMTLGFTGFGLMALAFVLFAERGKLFRAHHAAAPAKA
ncbi:multidrug effflux MFS transporter [Brevundimonas sp. PAMC22021]|uniref:multidrug effflux MFS transporter n=1 Tax=Brevundimonas sp. PAMC22021 TaxID=2861285 RepID=UPI001C627FFA|nr:multidrug effflux MFS transporter [Brevundimonas sp. PAMC22021]QYF86121.1 multidrug effflux MFS transporter [Brevundimonas sp. PAMC22021]